ncbi:MAG: zinc metalloprotease HtpX [Candidatus Omnitrophota bacterium]
MFMLRLKMWLLVTALFGIVYALIVILGYYAGINNFYFYLLASAGVMLLQYLLGPLIVEWTMQVRYIKREENPSLYNMVEGLAAQAGIPAPRVAISNIALPNAFAFGRSVRDGRVCVTAGILKLLNADELRAVLGHEISHIKNRDVLTITLLSVIPLIMYRIAWQLLFFGRRDSNRSGGGAALIGLVAFVFYFITNLLVLYASRIREYFADRGSIALGNPPSALASSLYKLVYGSARADKDEIREHEGLKAFFVNDPSQAMNELRELRQLDTNKDGTIDFAELAVLSGKKVRLSFTDKLMEALSTHPNMLRRIKKLSEYNN